MDKVKIEEVKNVSAAEEEKKGGDKDDYDDEYDSDYDEEGHYIWGEYGKDWGFDNEDDKKVFFEGLSTVPDEMILNPGALPKNNTEITIQATTAVSGETIIGASLARDGAVYTTTKKKLKAGRSKPKPAEPREWRPNF